MTDSQANLHGTAILLGGQGVLLRGEPGSGKSLLALELIVASGQGGPACELVADDRVEIRPEGDALMMQPPVNLAGLIELRGRGILEMPYRAPVRLALIVDLVEALERMPEPDAFATNLLGQTVPRAPVPRRGVVDSAHQRLLLFAALAALQRGNYRPPS